MKSVMIFAALFLTTGVGAVQAQQSNWGEEVKACNQTDCYPGGTSRGEYVSRQAKDSEDPGYAAEIHSLANPGKSDPKAAKFQ
jgi:hypothetical protein